MLLIKTLPIVEQWKCAGCARCCRGSLIWLNEDDLRKLSQQGWARRPELAGLKTIVRESWFGGRRRLAQREDGTCVFLLPDGRCRIHAEFGADAKPLACRMFPLQLVPLEKQALLTTRRSCPTAAADEGPELEQYRTLARELAKADGLLDKPVRAPAIVRRVRGTWNDALAVTDMLERLLSEANFPLVRRIAHGLRFCALLEQCRLRQLDTSKLSELCTVLETTSHDVSDLFQQRAEPHAAAAILFRQTAAEYLRLHPTFVARASWRERWRMARAAMAIARGKGSFPQLHPTLPDTTFEALEQPLGHVEESVQRPFLRFFETQAASKQYAIVCRPSWSVIESFRALALSYAVGLWLLRLISTGREPTRNDALDIVTIMDRGQGYAPLQSTQHRSRISTLAKLSELERLVVWYAR